MLDTLSDYRVCSKTVMDNIHDASISFDQNGISNYFFEYRELAEQELLDAKAARAKLEELVQQIKTDGRNKSYDCLIGLSGGVDSSYLAYCVSKFGLRPLAIHLDNGWNSEMAVKNIENIVSKLGFDLHTHVINWEEFKDLQRAYLKASVVDIEVLTDHAVGAVLYDQAGKNGIKYILSGVNVVTEGILPEQWIYSKRDWKNIQSIHQKFGAKKIKTFPYMSFWKRVKYDLLYNIQSVPLLNYVPYVKKEAQKIIQNELGWKDYGGKHFESIFTRFYQSYILPQKFGIDKRKAHLSTLICSGQLSREEALEELKKEIYPAKLLEEDKEYVIKKIGMTHQEFEEIMNAPVKKHQDYPSDEIKYKYYYFIKNRILKRK